MFGFDGMDNWYNELKEMNNGKMWESFHYPTQLISLITRRCKCIISSTI